MPYKRPEENVLKLFRCHYPNHPKTCVTDKIAEKPHKLERFQSKEKYFKQFAEDQGVDCSNGFYTQDKFSLKGLPTDNSRYIARQEDGSYCRVAFYS